MLGIGLSRARPTQGGKPGLRLMSGTGYAGSVIGSGRAGQWYQNGAPIEGQAGSTLTLSVEMEGAAITQQVAGVVSQPLQYFTPAHLTSAEKAGGGHWLAARQQSVVRGGGAYVSAWPDSFGQRDMAQTVPAQQPKVGEWQGQPVAVWEKSPQFQMLLSASNMTVKWWMVLAQFGTGSEIANAAATGVGSNAYLVSRGGGQATALALIGADLAASSAAMEGVRVNGDAPKTAGLLPHMMGSMSFEVSSANRTSAQWGIGWGYSVNQDRQWVGPIAAALALGEVPDTATRQKLEGYMHWRHGLAALLPEGHPYRGAPPQIL